jgi:hypothetical protein
MRDQSNTIWIFLRSQKVFQKDPWLNIVSKVTLYRKLPGFDADSVSISLSGDFMLDQEARMRNRFIFEPSMSLDIVL